MIKKAVIFLFITAALSAQDFGFGFGDDESADFSGAGSGFGVSISGEVSASMIGYLDDFSKGAGEIRLGDIFSGRLNFAASTAIAEGIVNLNIETKETPFSIDEAYLRAFLGDFEITAGFRKLTWGRADSMGPLDVINPLDTSRIYTAMADSSSLLGVKIARPLVHAAFRFGQSSKIEAIFVPWFQPHFIPAETDKWAPSLMKEMSGLETLYSFQVRWPDPKELETLDYAQAGLRFTTTIGSADIGAQYYYGRLPQPAVKVIIGSPPDVSILYNPYHQIGLDYAQVFFGFNVRAELAANITEDLKGDDGSIYNPSIAWSFGFDRDVFLGINLNLQVTESIRLMQDKLGGDMMSTIATLGGIPFDIESGSPPTATRLSAIITRKFLRDQLELRAAVVWGIEDKDCAIMPALIWTKEDLRFAFSGGFFAGNSEGQLGQYKDNNFIKVSLTYSF